MRRNKVLLFENKSTIRELILQALKDEGVKVVSVINEQDAIRYLQQDHFTHFITCKTLSIPFDHKTEVFHTSTLSEKSIHSLKPTELLSKLKTLNTKAKTQMIAVSSNMLEIREKIPVIASSEATVFISGESGTGKEVIAHLIHQHSDRKYAPFIRVNCAALPETLIESEFFGHEKGAFTGALEKRIGRFELAHHGTLLLDEVTEIPLALQAKLLRVLQEGEFERIGGQKSITVDVRIIATTNRDLKKALNEGTLREDLYYRLNVIPLTLPPLRKRKADIIPLAKHFLHAMAKKNHLRPKELSLEAIDFLKRYSWPGNVRELGNLMERALILSKEKQIGSADLHICTDISPQVQSHSFLTLKQLEKKHIQAVLSSCNNNKTKAAKILGICIRTLRNKLHQYDL